MATCEDLADIFLIPNSSHSVRWINSMERLNAIDDTFTMIIIDSFACHDDFDELVKAVCSRMDKGRPIISDYIRKNFIDDKESEVDICGRENPRTCD